MADETKVAWTNPWMVKRRDLRTFTFAARTPFPLDNGRSLSPVTIAYETYGRLNPTRDNAILVPHALTGDSHCASHAPDDEPGWWEGIVGPGKAIDTERWFVICPNVLGGCQGSTGPASIDPATGKPYGMRFPIVTVRDMVRVQHALVRHMGVQRLHAVVGGSMGGMQTLEWGVTYPDAVRRLIPICTPVRAAPQSIAYNEVGRQAIVRDPHWRDGDYYGTEGPADGLAVARMVAMITYQSDEAMWNKFGRNLHASPQDALADFRAQFEVERYLHYQGRKLVDRFDANTYILLTRALDLFDLGRDRGGIRQALRRIQAPTLVVGISSDILYPTYQQKEIVDGIRAAGGDARYEEIVCPHGHDGFLIETDQLTRTLRGFLES